MLMNSFYAAAIQDELIGDIFTDVASLDLVEHLPVIIDFCESVLFGVGKYQGNPVLKHVHLNQLSALRKDHFERWLSIWNTTIDQLYQGEKAEEAKDKAKMMADLMIYKIKTSQDDGFIQ